MPARPRRLAALILALVAGSCFGAAAQAGASVLLLPVLLPGQDTSAGGDAISFGGELRSGLGRNLAAAGYSVAEGKDPLSPDSPEPAEASRLARASGAAWAAVCELSLDGSRIAYRVAIYDAGEGSLAAGDTFSAFAGLAAVSLMNNSTARSVQKLALYESAKAQSPRRLVGYRVMVICPVEGAEVSVDFHGQSSGFPVGKIKGGRLELPYYPFLQGSTLFLSAGKKGMARMRASVPLGAEGATVRLKAPGLRADLLAGTGSGRLLGLGGGIRIYLDPDWAFFSYDERIYAEYDFLKGSAPLLHDEFWNGLGWYLFFPPASKFRMGYSFGYGFLFSLVPEAGAQDRLLFDLALLPIDFFGEYELGRDMAAWVSIGAAYSVGTNGSGLIGREWLGGGSPMISAGMLWRRR